ncbi:HindVP family restriction endonuclease [Paenibacillus sp. KS1]|uniref:HindVP family restriction endonuclease n=1 Tax=Paenibacillus sp. KS1 TaxID=1849249 RepID=UPI0008065E73|nr:HindVP family restriction endonuclease [Paenibacillus sp. KS1]OBY78611.1 HindVP family restriction endonuclease [Paenibacillus sp. KS1]
MDSEKEPALYGIENSNRKSKDFFGKNQFNSAFPVSLACYMRDTGAKANYLFLNDDLKVESKEVPFDEIFNTQLPTNELHFDFETKYLPYQELAYDDIRGIDLVIKHKEEFLRALEVKLTVLPDNATSKEDESKWGSEIVIRPASTSYCALGMVHSCQDVIGEVRELFEPVCHKIRNWSNHDEILNKKEDILNVLDEFQERYSFKQKPFLLQPIWKTEGVNPALSENAFDIFVWSDFALCRPFLDKSRAGAEITRYLRSSARLAKILYELSTRGKVNIEEIYTEMAFGLQTDKEFAMNGKMTREYMISPRRVKPAISKDVLTKIILNGGEKMLSPERRFDQSVYFTATHLFEEQNDQE